MLPRVPMVFPFADIVRGDVWLDAPPPDLAGDKPPHRVAGAGAKRRRGARRERRGPRAHARRATGCVRSWSFAGVKRAPDLAAASRRPREG